MIEWITAAGLPFAWFTADEEFGQNLGLCRFLEDEKIVYVMAIPENSQVTSPGSSKEEIRVITGRPREHDWSRRACGIGTKWIRKTSRPASGVAISAKGFAASPC